MSKQIIMCDIDGCLADFVKGFTTLAHAIWPNVPITWTKDQPRWDGFPGMTKEQVETVWKLVDKSSSFWENLEPMAYTSTFGPLRRLNETSQADLYFTTNRRGEGVSEQTKRWLYKQGINEPRVILVERKGELARAIGATYMIDDKAGNAVYAAYHAAPKLKSYILDRPYNQFDAEVVGSKVTRVKTMEEFLEDVWKAI